MHKTIVRDVRNIGRKECELPTDGPIPLESYEKHAEDHNHTKNEEIPRIPQEDLERIKPSKPQSNHRLLWLAIVTCLILIVVLLGGLLILSKKISHGCGCSEESGPQRLKSQPPRRISSEENGTNISDLVEYISSDLNELRAAMNGTKNDLAKLNRTVTTVTNINSDLNSLRAAIDGTKSDLTAKLNRSVSTIENLNSDLNDMKAAADGTKNDLPNLNTTITKVENLNADLIHVKAALDGAKNDLAELNRTVVTVEYISSDLNELRAAVNGTKNDLTKLNRTVATVENLNADLIHVKAALDGAKNDLAELNSTVVMGQDKPSAHIGSLHKGWKIYKANTVLKDWSNSTPYSHLAGGMTYHDGSLTVPTPGRYYIYAQILCMKGGRVTVRVNGIEIIMIRPVMKQGYETTLNAAGLFQLKAGDVIALYAVLEIKVYLERKNTYFGAFLI